MPTTIEYLSDLVEQKNTLADNINNNGVSASQEETLNTLVPKVNDVYTKGVEDGAQSEYDKFWDMFQSNGKRDRYDGAFCETTWGRSWSLGFTPKYPIKPRYMNYMFYYFNITGKTPLDLVQFFQDNNIDIDLGRLGSETKYIFYNSNISRAPAIRTFNAEYTFSYCRNLKTIDSLKIESPNYCYSIFSGCSALENITFVGDIKCNGLDLKPCPLLTVESILSLLNALYDYSSGTAHKLTLGTTNLNKLTDEQKAIATNKGWTLA